jgi:hypothetical protein
MTAGRFKKKRGGELYGGWKFNTEVWNMKSNHISTRRLHQAVTEKSILEQHEVEHLQTCEECLELVRLFVRQHLQKSKGTGQ